MQIRSAIASDATAIADIHVCGWRAAYRGVVPDSHLASLSVEKRQAYWVTTIEKGEPSVRVAAESDGVSGWVAFGASRDEGAAPGTGEIWAIYVSPGKWAQGIGRSLMAGACDELRRTGFRVATLWVLVKNERACRFYAREGFAPDPKSVKTVNVGGAALEEVRYDKELARQSP